MEPPDRSTSKSRVFCLVIYFLLGWFLFRGASLGGAAEENKTLPQTPPTSAEQAAALADVLDALQARYSTRLVLGEPMDVQGMKIIPVTLVGWGVGEQKGAQQKDILWGGGGVISPVGVIVLSTRGVEWLPVQRGLLTQLLEGISSLFLMVWRGKETIFQPPPSVPEEVAPYRETWLTRLFWTLPQDRFRFGVFPIPLGYRLLFLIGWLGAATLAGAFFPGIVSQVHRRLFETPVQAGLWGLLSLILGVLTLFLLALSIVGIPLMFVMGLLLIGALGLGLASIAALMGQRIAIAVRGRSISLPGAALLGAVLLGVLRLLPFVGWVLWVLLSILGFGAVLLAALRNYPRQ